MSSQAGNAVSTGLGKRSRSGTAIAAAIEASKGSGSLSVAGLPVVPSLGPYIQVQGNFPDQDSKRLVLALESGIKREVAWALNTLAVLSFGEKDTPQREQTVLTKVPGIISALLHVIEHWREGEASLEQSKPIKSLSERQSHDIRSKLTQGHQRPAARPKVKEKMHDNSEEAQVDEFWWTEEGLFNVNEEERGEKHQCAVAASNVLRNFSFLPENEQQMLRHSQLVDSLVRYIAAFQTEDEEIVTNASDTLCNLAPYLDLKSHKTPDKTRSKHDGILHALSVMLDSSVIAWHGIGAEAIARLALNPDNEEIMSAWGNKVFDRLADLLFYEDQEVQASAVTALAAFADMSSPCKIQLGSHKWVIRRLLHIIKNPHPVIDICRKAGAALESLASEPGNREAFVNVESNLAELAMSDSRLSDSMARVLWESSTSHAGKTDSARSIWGS